MDKEESKFDIFKEGKIAFNDFKSPSNKILSIEEIIDKLRKGREFIIKDSAELEYIAFEKIFTCKLSDSDKDKECRKKLFRDNFTGLYAIDGPARFVWITFTSPKQIGVETRQMAIEVGQTHFNSEKTQSDFGDFLNEIVLFKSPTSILLFDNFADFESIVLPTTEDDKRTFYATYLAVEKQLNTLVSDAIVIPLDISKFYYESSNKCARQAEKVIGDTIMGWKEENEKHEEKQLVPILNSMTHTSKPSYKNSIKEFF